MKIQRNVSSCTSMVTIALLASLCLAPGWVGAASVESIAMMKGPDR